MIENIGDLLGQLWGWFGSSFWWPALIAFFAFAAPIYRTVKLVRALERMWETEADEKQSGVKSGMKSRHERRPFFHWSIKRWTKLHWSFAGWIFASLVVLFVSLVRAYV